VDFCLYSYIFTSSTIFYISLHLYYLFTYLSAYLFTSLRISSHLSLYLHIFYHILFLTIYPHLLLSLQISCYIFTFYRDILIFIRHLMPFLFGTIKMSGFKLALKGSLISTLSPSFTSPPYTVSPTPIMPPSSTSTILRNHPSKPQPSTRAPIIELEIFAIQREGKECQHVITKWICYEYVYRVISAGSSLKPIIPSTY
jgi:hypothetical protein